MKKTLGCVILLYNSLLRLALVRFLSVHNFETLAFFESLAMLKTVLNLALNLIKEQEADLNVHFFSRSLKT